MTRALGLCAALGLGLGSMACADNPDRVLQRAHELIAEGDMDAAHGLLRTAAARLEQHILAGNGASIDLLARMLAVLGELNSGPLHNPAQAIADNGKILQLQQAAATAAPAPSLHEAAIAAQCRMADLYRDGLHEPEHAVTMLRAAAGALGARTLGAEVRQNLVATLMAMGNYGAAHLEAEAIIERWPNSHASSRARLTMGQADFMEGRFVRAAATLESLMDDSSDARMRALAQVEAGNCQQELGQAGRALELYYAALKTHPNPIMVQDKILRVRERIYHIAPKDSILNASRPSRHIAAWQPRPTPQDLGVGAPIVDGAQRR